MGVAAVHQAETDSGSINLLVEQLKRGLIRGPLFTVQTLDIGFGGVDSEAEIGETYNHFGEKALVRSGRGTQAEVNDLAHKIFFVHYLPRK